MNGSTQSPSPENSSGEVSPTSLGLLAKLMSSSSGSPGLMGQPGDLPSSKPSGELSELSRSGSLPVVSSPPVSGRESLLAFFGSEEIGQAVSQGMWTIKEEIATVLEIIRSPGMKASDRLTAMKYLNSRMETALRMDGIIVEERKTGQTVVKDRAGNEALLTQTQAGVRLLGEGMSAMQAAMATSLPGTPHQEGLENDPQ